MLHFLQIELQKIQKGKNIEKSQILQL